MVKPSSSDAATDANANEVSEDFCAADEEGSAPATYPTVERWQFNLAAAKKDEGNKSFKLNGFTGHGEDIKWAVRRYSEGLRCVHISPGAVATVRADACQHLHRA